MRWWCRCWCAHIFANLFSFCERKVRLSCSSPGSKFLLTSLCSRSMTLSTYTTNTQCSIFSNWVETLEFHFELPNYRVFRIEMYKIKALIGHLKLNYEKSICIFIGDEHLTYDSSIWLKVTYIPVLHTLSSKGLQNFTWNSIILSKRNSKHKKKEILAISLLISRT